MKLISIMLLTCALILSGVAAYYSIIGLATIFSSAFWPVVVMASMLEISKLVLASWLYHNWRVTPKLLRSYLTSAVIILMMITSLGIFGFLSKAFLDQNLITSEAQLRLELIQSEIVSVEQIRHRYEQQLAQLDRSIDIQLNANRAQGALAARRQQQAERAQIRSRLDAETEKLTSLNQERTRLQQHVNVIESEVGPIRYVAQLFTQSEQVDLESAVTYMIVVIVLVFDPLAVLMIVAANMSLSRHTSTNSQIAHEHSAEPRLGSLQWDSENRIWQVFSPQGWQPLPVSSATSSPLDQDPQQLQTALAEALDAWLQRSLSVQHTVDPNLIKDTVADTIKQVWQELNLGTNHTTNPSKHWGVHAQSDASKNI